MTTINGNNHKSKQFSKRLLLLAVLMLVLAFFPWSSTAFAQPDPAVALYGVQLKNVVIPKRLLEKTRTEPKKLKNAQIYVEVSVNGTPVWRSIGLDAAEEGGRKERFVFPEETAFPLIWEPGCDVFVQIKMAGKKALYKAFNGALVGGGVGGVAGGVAGGVIVGTAAGAAASTAAGAAAGVVGGPVGIAIGAGVGLGIGSVAGALIGGTTPALLPVKGEREIASFVIPSDKFGLEGTLETDIASSEDLLLTGRASVEWKGRLLQKAITGGGLKNQKTYMVKVCAVRLSDQAKKFKPDAEYYLRLKSQGMDDPIELDLGKLPANTIVSLDYTLAMKKSPGESSVEIRRKAIGWDPLVFKTSHDGQDRMNWVFTGKHEDENGSFVEFETYSMED